MYHALDLGFSAGEFWMLSPRAILSVQRAMPGRGRRKPAARGDDGPASVRLNYLPRP